MQSNPNYLTVLQAPVEIPPEQALAIVARQFGILLYPNRRYDVRVEIRSWSTEEQNYRVAHDRVTGNWSCGCKGWVLWHQRKGDGYRCQHLKEMVPPLELALELQSQAIPQPAGIWY